MHSTSPFTLPHAIDVPAMRQAGPGLLSLALMDARNHTLHLLTQHENAAPQAALYEGTGEEAPAQEAPIPSAAPLWLAGYAGWFAEYWIGRNTQRTRGPACVPQPTRLASVQPQADSWWNPRLQSDTTAWDASALADAVNADDLPDTVGTRSFLLQTLEQTLELLEKTPNQDAALYFYRLALFHEDLCGEALVQQAQALGVSLGLTLPALGCVEEPVQLPAMRWSLGAPSAGFSFDVEQGHCALDVPAFEIDAQPVRWEQFMEFVLDGGYNCQALWQPRGWAWLQHQPGRTAPRYVECHGMGSGAATQRRFGQTLRLEGRQAAMHVSWWEADAWCRWAGRRLPSEAEWEIAVHQGTRQGFRWGDVHEWMANPLQPWEGFQRSPWSAYSSPFMGTARVLRGASFATRARMKTPHFRGFALPAWDEGFVGFRSCAL